MKSCNDFHCCKLARTCKHAIEYDFGRSHINGLPIRWHYPSSTCPVANTEKCCRLDKGRKRGQFSLRRRFLPGQEPPITRTLR